MMVCVDTGVTILSVATSAFTLGWSHSVEHTQWVERWQVEDGQLHLIDATVQGSGAGMTIPDNAVKGSDGWTYTVDPPLRVPELFLAASGMTDGGWTLCASEGCQEIGTEAQANGLRIWPDEDCEASPE
ncbi:DUF1850 domain-containing protein [Paracoccus sp. TK19116]|uniref:DUF1850 domain-containing protein n=1 Tax=Paracoccus albicereus TaxID=2922394 RepID=A0ABT1MPI5_9RHOB|nr:DUF1850 domain-containing protein [Paracoccus albicereus]MCQ0970213.1 DUF1850 domain-containing protein [Paracoccus albicereus]